MSIEPDGHQNHIFDNFETAQKFYEALVQDMSLTDEQREQLSPPRQAHFGTWIMDKVR
jgi:hypothetical protein